MKIVKTVFANVGYDVRLNSEYWNKKGMSHKKPQHVSGYKQNWNYRISK